VPAFPELRREPPPQRREAGLRDRFELAVIVPLLDALRRRRFPRVQDAARSFDSNDASGARNRRRADSVFFVTI
jgi:hypothetical protein